MFFSQSDTQTNTKRYLESYLKGPVVATSPRVEPQLTNVISVSSCHVAKNLLQVLKRLSYGRCQDPQRSLRVERDCPVTLRNADPVVVELRNARSGEVCGIVTEMTFDSQRFRKRSFGWNGRGDGWMEDAVPSSHTVWRTAELTVESGASRAAHRGRYVLWTWRMPVVLGTHDPVICTTCISR